jgi:ABC-type multidrug transport system fused ATPase/permease subunit
MELSPFLVISGAVALAIGQYALLSYHIGERFVQRYKALKDAFSKWQDEEAKKFRGTLQDKTVEEEAPEDIVNFVREWTTKNQAVKSLDADYWRLDSVTKAVLALSALSVLTGMIALFQPTSMFSLPTLPTIPTATTQQVPIPVYWVNVSLVSFCFAVWATLYYIWRIQSLNSIISRFEIGASIEEIIKLLVQRTSE